MERTGLLAKLAIHLNAVWDSKTNLRKLEKAQQTLLETLKEIRLAQDIALILQAEKAVLYNEIQFYAHDTADVKTYQKALTGLAEAQQSYRTLSTEPEFYVKCTHETIGKHKRSLNTIPESDLFLDFHKSHQRLLTSWMSGGQLTSIQKRFYLSRKENLKLAFSLYKELQQKALGVEEGKGMER